MLRVSREPVPGGARAGMDAIIQHHRTTQVGRPGWRDGGAGPPAGPRGAQLTRCVPPWVGPRRTRGVAGPNRRDVPFVRQRGQLDPAVRGRARASEQSGSRGGGARKPPRVLSQTAGDSHSHPATDLAS